MAVQVLLDGIQLLRDSVRCHDFSCAAQQQTVGISRSHGLDDTVACEVPFWSTHHPELVDMVVGREANNTVKDLLRQGRALKLTLCQKMQLL
jgi:hypothetical protein